MNEIKKHKILLGRYEETRLIEFILLITFIENIF